MRLAIVACFVALLLAACATSPEKPEGQYDLSAREHLYKVTNWSFDGRMALTGKKDSWSANIAWKHSPESDQIKLSGPLGQGATLIELSGSHVVVNRGGGDVQQSGNPEVFVSQQLGLFVPIQALRYWVVGLPQPDVKNIPVENGFSQMQWLVQYLQMQAVKDDAMPRKMSVGNGQVKLKLFIDEWILNSENAR